MAHCPYDKLADVEVLFDRLRTWPNMREPKPGIFYFKSKPFLHFHIKDAKRWADVRSADAWESIDAPMPLGAKQLKTLAKKIEEHYRRLERSPRPI